MKNPYEFKLESRMTNAERAEAVAHVAWEELQNKGEVSFNFLMAFFPTWGEKTLTKGIEMVMQDNVRMERATI